MSEVITADLVDLDLKAADRQSASRQLAERLVAAGRVTDIEGFLADIAKRESQMPTGLEGGIGIPHCRSAHVAEPSLAFGRASGGVDFGAPDGPADIIFLIAAPEGGDASHMKILASLARRLIRAQFKERLRSVQDPAGSRGVHPFGGELGMKFVAVTSCPTGIAHTYMAAEALEQAAADSGDEMHVETQGSAGSDPLDPQIIADADAVIFAADVEVRDRERFAGKPLVQSGVKRAIGGAAEMLNEARAAAAAGPPAGGAAPAGAAAGGGLATKVDSGAGFGTRLRGWLMTGVSYVIPFVAAGGLLIALSFALGGYEITDAPKVTEQFDWGSLQSWAALMFQIGGIAFGFLVPILAGFIAFAMGDRPALVPGIVGGFIAVEVQAGFIGGLIAGLLAGAVVLGIRKIKVPRSVAGIMPVVVIPLVSTLIVGILMFVVLGPPLAALAAGLTDWLNGLSGANKIILGIILGLMMGFDMGGPINKTAYSFAALGLAAATPASFEIMAAVMAAGMTPPLGLALATVIRKKLFTHVERENGKAAWVLGASFITEGAIPFAAGDPLRVIPSLMAGSAVTGGLSMAFGCTSRAPHGGIFVVPLIGNPFLYLLAIIIGTVVTAFLVVTLKSFHRTPEEAADETPATEAAATA